MIYKVKSIPAAIYVSDSGLLWVWQFCPSFAAYKQAVIIELLMESYSRWILYPRIQENEMIVPNCFSPSGQEMCGNYICPSNYSSLLFE